MKINKREVTYWEASEHPKSTNQHTETQSSKMDRYNPAISLKSGTRQIYAIKNGKGVIATDKVGTLPGEGVQGMLSTEARQ